MKRSNKSKEYCVDLKRGHLILFRLEFITWDENDWSIFISIKMYYLRYGILHLVNSGNVASDLLDSAFSNIFLYGYVRIAITALGMLMRKGDCTAW